MEQLQAVVENRTGFCLDPRTKLLLMAVVATAEFLYSHTAFMIAVAMIPFVLLLTNRQYKTATVFFCLFAAGLFVQAIQNSVQFPMIVNMLVVLLVGLVLRLFPAFVMGAYIIKSTTASECITALGRIMQKINLRELYPDVYKTDVFVDVAEEVVAAIRGQEQDDAAYERRKFRHKAHYSLNREDGIENDALNRPLTTEEVLEQKLLREEVYAALMQLTAIQARRIYARFYLGMTVAEIARIEGADRRRVWESIRRGLKKLARLLDTAQ